MAQKTNQFVNTKNAIYLGLALFAIMFGAGNLIFPLITGLESSNMWPVGFLGYFIADVGLAMLSLVALAKSNGNMFKITSAIGKIPSIIVCTTIVTCIGPLLAIPRTAATTFEMACQAFTGEPGDPIAAIIFSIIFFTIVIIATINPIKAVNTVGKILTPFLIASLSILIIVGLVNPAAPTGPQHIDNLIQNGILCGYQSVDMMGNLFVCVVIMKTITHYGYKDNQARKGICFIAGITASVLLLLIYGGLAYLGASTGQLWVKEYMSDALSPASLLANIANVLLGGAGATVLSIAVLMACLTTAIGLVTACADYFHDLAKQKINYHLICVIICAISALLCNVGLTQIINFSAPILMLLYPIVIVLVVCYLLLNKQDAVQAKNKDERLSQHNATNKQELKTVPSALSIVNNLGIKAGSAIALVISFCSLLVDNLGIQSFAWVHSLPFDEIGTNWLIPTVIGIALGICIEKLYYSQRINK